MKVQVNNWILTSNDHLWLEDSKADSYTDNNICDGCGDKMEQISTIKNRKGESGLTTGLCSSCGYVKRTRNLPQAWYNEHFSKKWLIRRNERAVRDEYVFKKISKYISRGGSILDVGCGLGDRLLPFHEAGFNVHGVDPSRHRSALAAEMMGNIATGICEEYLDKSTGMFDGIYIFNVLQFVENPFLVLEKAVNRLIDGGIIYFRVGQFYDDSNYLQFAHMGVIRSFLTLYSMKAHFRKLDLWPIEYSDGPFEIVLRKCGQEDPRGILDSAIRLTMDDVERYARKTINPIRLKMFGKTSIKYQGRKILLKQVGSFDRIVPVEFFYDQEDLPLLLK